MSPELKMVHEQLRNKINNTKRNRLRNLLRSHLHEIMPTSLLEKSLMPFYTIALASKRIFKVDTAIK